METPIRLLITGAQGFIGRHFVAHCLGEDSGANVLGVGRSKDEPDCFTHSVTRGNVKMQAPLPQYLSASAEGSRYRYLSLDVRDKLSMTDVLRDFRPNLIVHLAGSLRDETFDRLIANNVVAVEALFEAVVASSIVPPRIILGSTGFVYGAAESSNLPLDENSPRRPNELYGLSKRFAEDTASILSRRYGIPTIYARIFQVVGPGQDERHLCGWLASQFAAIRSRAIPPKVAVGPLITTRDFIDVRDVARALYALVQAGKAGQAYNIASGIETGVQRIYDELLRLSALPGNVEVIRRPGRSEDTPRLYAKVSRLSELGYLPRYDLTASLADVLQYYLDVVYTKPAAGQFDA